MIRLLLLPPNLITMSRPIAVAVLCYYLIHDPVGIHDGYVGLVIFLFFYWITDFIDGYVAKLTGTTSEFGGKFDLFCDRLCDFIVVFTILAVHDLAYSIEILSYMLGRLAPEFLYFQYAGSFSESPLFKNWTKRAYKIYGEVFHFIRTVFFAAVLFLTPHWSISAIFVVSNMIFLLDAILILKHFAESGRNPHPRSEGNGTSSGIGGSGQS